MVLALSKSDAEGQGAATATRRSTIGTPLAIVVAKAMVLQEAGVTTHTCAAVLRRQPSPCRSFSTNMQLFAEEVMPKVVCEHLRHSGKLRLSATRLRVSSVWPGAAPCGAGRAGSFSVAAKASCQSRRSSFRDRRPAVRSANVSCIILRREESPGLSR